MKRVSRHIYLRRRRRMHGTVVYCAALFTYRNYSVTKDRISGREMNERNEKCDADRSTTHARAKKRRVALAGRNSFFRDRIRKRDYITLLFEKTFSRLRESPPNSQIAPESVHCPESMTRRWRLTIFSDISPPSPECFVRRLYFRPLITRRKEVERRCF